MKRQILTLTMCLALTATSALASGTATVAKKSPVKPACKVSKAVKPVANVTTKCAEPQLTKEQLAKKQFEEKMAKARDNFYNDLGLTAEQKTKAETLDAKNRAEAQPLMQKVREEKTKMRDLKAKNASVADLAKQKKEVKAARKALKAHFEASKKSFEALLTPEQKTKLAALEAKRKAEHKNCPCKSHKHHHYHGPEGGAPEGPMGPAPMGPAPVGAPGCPCGK